MEQFQCIIDRKGNIIVASGWVFQTSSGTLMECASDEDTAIANPPGAAVGSGMAPTAPAGTTFVGGSGRLLIATPSATLSNADAPKLILGFYAPSSGSYNDFTCTTNPACLLAYDEIHDGTDVVATWASGASAPLGVFTATTYGETTYNGGNPFDITITDEVSGGLPPASAEVLISAGTAQGGNYSSADAFHSAGNITFLSDDDPDWMLIVNTTTQEVQMIYVSDLVASSGSILSFDDPSGLLDSVSFGETTYNGGDPFTVKVNQRNAIPREGHVIVQCNLVAGVLTSVDKPFFSDTIPANTSTEIYHPIFTSDGAGRAQQLHTGLLIIP